MRPAYSPEFLLDRLTPDLLALGFQSLITLSLALVHLLMWRDGRGRHHAAWAAAWLFYALRLVLISRFIAARTEGWLFAHQVATVLTAMLLLSAALQFSRGSRWRMRFLPLAILPVAWAWFAVYVIHDIGIASASGAVLLSAVTFWTGWVLFRHHRVTRSGAALVLAWTFTLWGLHHLDYPLLRQQGHAVLFGVFADVFFIIAVAGGTLALVLGEGSAALAARNAQLEELTRLLLSAQEDERHRIARELHDEAGQALTAVKIELDLDGRTEASALVARVLNQVRDVSNLLRPSVLDDLGLEAALRSLLDDFSGRARLAVELDCRIRGEACSPQMQVAIFRVVQEALTNVARHAGARRVAVSVVQRDQRIELTVQDDGRGAEASPVPHLGLLGMRERISELGGEFSVNTGAGVGFRIHAWLPLARGG
jgi:signal transduction histidine kinase